MARKTYEVVVDENIEDSLKHASWTLSRDLPLVAEQVEETLERHIRGAYQSGPTRWQPKIVHNPGGGRGFAPANLWETGALAGAVSSLDIKAHFVKSHQAHVLTLSMDAPWPENSRGRPYVWYHEFGTKNMARRDFIETGFNKAAPEIVNLIDAPISKIRLYLQRPEALGVKKVTHSSAAQPRGFLSLLSPLAWATVLVPPVAPFSHALLIWGVSSDLKAAMTGSLFNAGALRNFISGWALGSVGMTARVQRRRARRNLWSGAVR